MSLACQLNVVNTPADRAAIGICCGSAPGFNLIKTDCAMDLAVDEDERLLVDETESNDRLLLWCCRKG